MPDTAPGVPRLSEVLDDNLGRPAAPDGVAGRMSLSIVIPAYEPAPSLPAFVDSLASAVTSIVVVDDGSGMEYRAIFESVRAVPGVILLEHPMNRGKGAALKTGIQHALAAQTNDIGIVTADADGQHDAADVLRVAAALAAQPTALTLGVRHLSATAPARSRLGNAVTRTAVRLVIGHALTDTQTGLRGVPRALAAAMLDVSSTRYEFELDMLIACRRLRVPIREVAIRTIYLDGNRSSHFRPLIDSIRIACLLARYVPASIFAALNAMVGRSPSRVH